MNNVNVFEDKYMLAYAAANTTIATLSDIVDKKGRAVWAIAGGSTPELAYQIITEQFIDAVDWSKITILIGDERIAPLDSEESNWHKAEQLLLCHVPEATLLRPASSLSVNEAADDYNRQLVALLHEELLQLDVLWLGVGEDGHTLSLFPQHDQPGSKNTIVMAIYNAPKPPAERISLTITAVRFSKQCYILAAGEAKSNALHRAYTDDLPIAQVAQAIEQEGGIVTWLLDEPAAQLL